MEKGKEQELKEKLERALYRGKKQIDSRIWGFFKDNNVLDDCISTVEDEKQGWNDFRDCAKDKIESAEWYFDGHN